jgi:Holliday junction resolvasome RuvABC endonuclease subunit
MPHPNNSKRILAIDPARLTGYAHSNGARGTWDIGVTDARLAAFKDLLRDAAQRWGCDLIAYEDASFGSPNPNVQALHNELRGVIKLFALEVEAETISYHPTTIKKFATGSGRAKKTQMRWACQTLLGFIPHDDNEADAAFILAMARLGYLPPKQAARQIVKNFKHRHPRLF